MTVTEASGQTVPSPNGAAPADEPSLGDLFAQLTSEASELFRAQLELAKVELREEAKEVGKVAAMFAGVAVAALLVLALLSGAAAWGLAAVIPTGWAFFIVAIAWAGVAGLLFTMARANLERVREPAPETIETIKEDVAWARQQKS